jgi:prepilin signal peptidase PulO-like enzyme (type II secretory pathway)
VPKQQPSVWEELTVADVVSNVFVETATLFGVFFLGAMVGSFVNVVLYRVPLRLNLLWPPSRCPVCLHRLKLIDNVPVLSWLRLRGKCRHCGTAIPRSYLRTEVRFGLLFLALTYIEIHTGGLNLPVRGANQYPGALWNLWYPKPDLVCVWLYHLLGGALFAALYLFARRGEFVPGALACAAALGGAVPAALVPGLHLAPLAGATPGAIGAWQRTGAAEALVGAGAGALLGVALALLWRPRAALTPTGTPRLALPPRADAPALLAVVGAFLGWQAALSVAVLAALIGFARPGAPPAARLALGAAVQFALGGALARFAPWWPGPHTAAHLVPVWVLGAFAIALLRRGPSAPQQPEPPSAAEAPPSEPAVPAADSSRTTSDQPL